MVRIHALYIYMYIMPNNYRQMFHQTSKDWNRKYINIHRERERERENEREREKYGDRE